MRFFLFSSLFVLNLVTLEELFSVECKSNVNYVKTAFATEESLVSCEVVPSVCADSRATNLVKIFSKDGLCLKQYACIQGLTNYILPKTDPFICK